MNNKATSSFRGNGLLTQQSAFYRHSEGLALKNLTPQNQILQRKRFRMTTINLIASLTLAMTLLVYPALAQDTPAPTEEKTGVIYSPDHCEFSVTFPDEPYKTRKCDGGECYDQITYTQVYDMASTVNIKVLCNKISEGIRDKYDGSVMQATLRAMTKDNVVQTFDTTFRETEDYKQAGLVGEGHMGRTPTIYIAQLWIGAHSAFSLEAELIGDAHEEADKLFKDILQSAHYKTEETEEKTADPEEVKSEKPEESAGEE